MNRIPLRFLPALLPLLFSASVSAAAFQLMEQNASGLGVSYAGSAASAENASTIFFNPAGMALLPGRQLSLGISAVGPNYRFRNQGSYAGPGLNGSDGGNAGSWAALPNAYLSWQVTPQWHLGLGISSPFGLATKYEDPDWIGRFHALKTEIRTVNINPALAYRLNDKVALGLGVNYQRVDAEMSNQSALGLSRLKGDNGSWGWNAGALFTLSPAMRIGLAYRSAIAHTIQGTQTLGSAVSLPASARLKLPDSLTLSVWQQVSDRWEAMGDLSYTRWNTLDRLNVVTPLGVAVEPFAYKNSWRIAWGAAYQYTPDWKLKFGIAYDRTPITTLTRSARVPDNNRLWLSLGAQWKPGRDSVIDLGYAYLYVKDPAIHHVKSLTPVGTAALIGQYDASAHILGVQFTQGF